MIRKCDYCGEDYIDDGLDEEWYKDNGAYCSSECSYADENGGDGSDY